jgi:malonyl-CoA O-methyltransferase
MDTQSRGRVESAGGMTPSVHLDIEAAYDRWAPTYDTYDNPMVYAANAALTVGLGGVKGLDCLEFGCGTGRNLAAMASAGARTVTGFDLSRHMLAQAHLRNQDAPAMAWTLVHHDINAPAPLPSASANFILFSLTLEHIREVAVPLMQARRLLRRYGTIRIVEIHPFMSLNGDAAHFKDGDQDITMPTFPHQFQDWFKAFEKTGLVMEDMREWPASDFGPAAPEKLKRRGPNWPWLVDFTLRGR